MDCGTVVSQRPLIVLKVLTFSCKLWVARNSEIVKCTDLKRFIIMIKLVPVGGGVVACWAGVEQKATQAVDPMGFAPSAGLLWPLGSGHLSLLCGVW